MVRLNDWPISGALQLFALLIICNYLTDRTEQPPKATWIQRIGAYCVRCCGCHSMGMCGCEHVRYHVYKTCAFGANDKDEKNSNAHLIVSYPILCVAFSIIRYIYYVHSLTLFVCDIVWYIRVYIIYTAACQHKYNPWLTTTHCHRIWYCCALCFVTFFLLVLLYSFARFVACFCFIECARNVWDWLWPPKVEFHLHACVYCVRLVSMFLSHASRALPYYWGYCFHAMCALVWVCVCVLMFYFCTLRSKQINDMNTRMMNKCSCLCA